MDQLGAPELLGHNGQETMRSGKVSLLAIVLLFSGFAGLGTYHYLNKGRYASNAGLVQELALAPLAVVETPLGKPGEWPQWRGPFRDGVSRETGLLTEWPERGPRVLWRVPFGLGYSSMAVAGGKVFTHQQVDNEEVIVCLDAATGKELWTRPFPGQYPVDRAFGPCPRSTPTVDGDHVYATCGNGLFACLQAEDGAVLWQHDLLGKFGARLPQWAVAGSPLIEGDLVVLNPGGPAGSSIAAFKKADGQLAWKTGDDPAGYSSAVAATVAGTRQVVVFTGTSITGVARADGKILWRYPWHTAYDCNVATPIVRGDYVFISSGYGKGCALLRIAKNGPALAVESVYEHNEMCNHFSSCVYHDEHLYGFNDQVLTCMNFRTGKVAWTKKGFARGSLLGADGQLIVLGENGQLAVAAASPTGFLEKAAFRFSRKRCWSVPVLAEGRLYVRDEEQLVCFDVKQPN